MKQYIAISLITLCHLLASAQQNHTPQLGFTSLKKETTNHKLSSTGLVPEWLQGSFVLVGPGIFELNSTTAQNWLDGFAMVHTFSISKESGISYGNKVLNSTYYQECCKSGKLRGSRPEQKKSAWSKFTSALSSSTRPVYDNANINLLHFNDRLIAATETPNFVSLDTNKSFTFDDKVEMHFCAAHPLYDPKTKEWFGLGIQFAHTSNYIIFKMDQNCTKRNVLASLPVGYPAYMHSFALTPNYVVLTEHPYTVSPYDLLLSDHSFIENFSWKPTNGTTFYLIDRRTGKKVGSYKTEAFFALHHVNAIEKDNTVILDVITHKNPDMLTKGFNYADLCGGKTHPPLGHLKRFTINIKNASVGISPLMPQPIELPHINGTKYMHEYRYLYATSGQGGMTTELIKIDLHHRNHLTWQCKECYPTEPIFVARPHAKDEDDGVLLSAVLDCTKGTSFLLILDAKTMKELARAYLPHHIPFTLHSKFL